MKLACNGPNCLYFQLGHHDIEAVSSACHSRPVAYRLRAGLRVFVFAGQPEVSEISVAQDDQAGLI